MSDKQTAARTDGTDQAEAATAANAESPSTESPNAESPNAETPAEAGGGDAAAASPPAADADPAARLPELEAALEQARREAAEQYEQLLRTRADMDNLRKRTARDLENAHKFALERFALELLPVRDSLELGLAAADEAGAEVAKLREGTELTLKLLTAALAKHGIVEVAPAGEKFDPELHQAMATQPSSEVEPGQVLTVYQKGYTLNDRLLRPALVIVSAAPAPAGDGDGA